MKRWLLTLPLLLVGMVSLVHADYVLLVINASGAPPGTGTAPAPKPNEADLVSVIVESEASPPLSVLELQKFGQLSRDPVPVFVPYDKLKELKPATTPLKLNLTAHDNLKYRNLRIYRYSDTSQAQVYTIPDKDSKGGLRAPHGLKKRFDKKNEAKNKKPLDLAEWALTHGLINDFTATMDKLARDVKDEKALEKLAPTQEDKDKLKAAVAIYLKAKERIGAKLPDPDLESPLINRLKQVGFTNPPMSRDHYLLLHNVDPKYVKDINSRLDRCEDAFKTYYYWFALRNEFPPLPPEKLIVIVAQNDEADLRELRAIVPASSRVGDGFFVPREGILCLSLLSRDPTYEKVAALAKKRLEDQISVDGFLAAVQKTSKGILPPSPPPPGGDPVALTLAAKLLECDAERWTVSHNAARQLAFASGVLPRNVIVPEWIKFGLGSFFECSQGAVEPSPSNYNPIHLYNWKNLIKKSDGTPEEILKKVVTDAFFREARRTEDADALAKARAASWALTYYLTYRKPDQLKAYCDELKKLPRDLDLDDEVLLGAFARAVGAEVNKMRIDAELTKLANKWQEFIEEAESQEDVTLAFGIFDTFKDMKKAMLTAP